MFLRSPATKKRDDKRQKREAFLQIMDAEPSDSTLKNILENPHLRNEFKSFLSAERGDENIQFWEAVEIFKSLEEDSLAEEANLIVRRFVGFQSDRTINIAGDVKEKIVKSMKQSKHTKELFDEATQQVFQLMKNDSLLRFLVKCKEEYGEMQKN